MRHGAVGCTCRKPPLLRTWTGFILLSCLGKWCQTGAISAAEQTAGKPRYLPTGFCASVGMDQYCGNRCVSSGRPMCVPVCVCSCLWYLWPCAAARLYEFMSPSGAEEMPFRHMVPIMGSAPLSKSRLTSSKLPREQNTWIKGGMHSHKPVVKSNISRFSQVLHLGTIWGTFLLFYT